VNYEFWGRSRINPYLLCFESCPPSADLYFGYLNLSASGGFVSDFEFMVSAIPYGRISDFLWLLISSQSQEVQKKCSKTVNFLQFLLKTRSFLAKNANKCKFLLIFTLIFSPKTNKSYKITLFTTANHPIFQNFPQKPNFFKNLPQKTIPK
jgi:hypothetical protein